MATFLADWSHCHWTLILVLVLALILGSPPAPVSALGRIHSADARNSSDVQLIEYEIKNLNRPELLLDNSVLVQEVDSHREVTEYRWITIRRDDRDGDVDRAEKSHVVLTRPGIEVGQNNIIFNSGEYRGFGPKTKRAYIVLRKYGKVAHPHTYLVNLVYIWNIGTRQEIHIEWCSFDEVDYLTLNTDNKIERALCRDDDCDFPQWIFGTCEIVSQDCSAVLAAGLRSGDDDLDDHFRNFRRRLRRRSHFGKRRGHRDRNSGESDEDDDDSDDNDNSDHSDDSDDDDVDDILGRGRGRRRGGSNWRSKVRRYWREFKRGRGRGRGRKNGGHGHGRNWDAGSRWSSRSDGDPDSEARSREFVTSPSVSGIRIRVPSRKSKEKDDDVSEDDLDDSNDDDNKSKSKLKKLFRWPFGRKRKDKKGWKKSSKENKWWSRRRGDGDNDNNGYRRKRFRSRDRDSDESDEGIGTRTRSRTTSKGPSNYYKYLEQKLENDANEAPLPSPLNIGDQRLQTHLDAPGPEADTPMHWEPDGHVLRQRRSAEAVPNPQGGGSGTPIPSNYYKLLEQIRDRQKQGREVWSQRQGKAQGVGLGPPSMGVGSPMNFSPSGPPPSRPPRRGKNPRRFSVTLPPDLTADLAVQQQRAKDLMMMKAISDMKRGMSSVTTPGIADTFTGSGKAKASHSGSGNDSTNTNSTISTPTPTSFDLLLLDRVYLPNGSAELGFKSEVSDKHIARDTLDAELKQICYDCASIGNFYDDFMERPKVSRRIGRILKKQRRRKYSAARRRVYKYPGSVWRNATGSRAGPETVAPFVGFGDCGSGKLIAVKKSPRHPKSAQLDDVIQFYVEILRVQCKEDLQTQLRSWLTSKLNFTNVQADLSLGIMPSSLIMKYNLLSKEEYEILFSAALLSQFTMRFVEETNLGLLAKDNRVTSPTSRAPMQLSPQTGFLKRLVLRFLTYIQYQIPQHYVKFTRSLIQLLQDKFFTLLMDRIRMIKAYRRMTPSSPIAPVPRTAADTRAKVSNAILLNYNDLQHIMGLKEYIIFGIEPSLKSGVANRDTYQSFYALNEKRMKYLVDSYHID